LAWRIEYAETAKKQLRKLDKIAARRIVDFMDERIASGNDPRRLGKALKGPLGDLWCYRVLSSTAGRGRGEVSTSNPSAAQMA
jgi:mRNA interferase RelE/StbE